MHEPKNNLKEQLAWLDSSAPTSTYFGGFTYSLQVSKELMTKNDSKKGNFDKLFNKLKLNEEELKELNEGFKHVTRDNQNRRYASLSSIGFAAQLELENYRVNEVMHPPIFPPINEERRNNDNSNQLSSLRTLDKANQSYHQNLRLGSSHTKQEIVVEADEIPDSAFLEIDLESIEKTPFPCNEKEHVKSDKNLSTQIANISERIDTLTNELESVNNQISLAMRNKQPMTMTRPLKAKRDELEMTIEQLSEELHQLQEQGIISVNTKSSGKERNHYESSHSLADRFEAANVNKSYVASKYDTEYQFSGPQATANVYNDGWDNTPQAINQRIAQVASHDTSTRQEFNKSFHESPFAMANGFVQDSSDFAPDCHCGAPARAFTSQQAKSQGQVFFKCAQRDPTNNQPVCNFFQWKDPSFNVSNSSFHGGDNSFVLRDPLIEVRRRFGHQGFRAGQYECIRAALDGRDVFCLMPTGGGKSIVYQVPAWCSRGVAVVFSPLISLIQDQVDALIAVGIRAVFLSSTQDNSEIQSIIQELRSYCYQGNNSSENTSEILTEDENRIKLLYITPEKFSKSNQLRNLLEYMARNQQLSRFVIDEAHCLSQWGHDFRPDYLSLSQLRSITDYRGKVVPVMCLTATAKQSVLNDCIHLLKMKENNVFIHTQSFNRSNLSYYVRPKISEKKVVDDIASYIRSHQKQSGIIYCLSRKDCESLCEQLSAHAQLSKTMRHQITFYHADISAAEKEQRQRLWSKGDIKVIIATVAFGMGINKPDVRYVIHHSLPKSLTNYYQESGRAGRDNEPAECILYFSPKDKAKILHMIMKSGDNNNGGYSRYKQQENTQRAIESLHKCVEYCVENVDCRRAMLLRYFGEAFQSESCRGTCDNCQFLQQHPGQVLVQDMRSHVIRILQTLKVLEQCDDNRNARITALKLVKLLTGSKDKDSMKYQELLSNSNNNHLHNSNDNSTELKLTKSTCEQLLQHMTIQQLLREEYVVSGNGFGFGSDYIQLGEKAYQYLHSPKPFHLRFRKATVTSATTTTATSNHPTLHHISDEDLLQLDPDQIALEAENNPTNNINKKSNKAKNVQKNSSKKSNKASTTTNSKTSTISTAKSARQQQQQKKKNKNYSTRDISYDLSCFDSAEEIDPNDDDDEDYDDNDDGFVDLSESARQHSTNIKTNLSEKSRKFHQITSLIDSDNDDNPLQYQLPQSSIGIKKARRDDVSGPILIDMDEPDNNISSRIRRSHGKRSALLTKEEAFALLSWLEQYRKRWWNYWNYLNNNCIVAVIDQLPMTIDELAMVPGIGESKAKNHGENMLATLYAFYEKYNLLHKFPEAKLPPNIVECPTWRDPFSEEAKEIHARMNSAPLMYTKNTAPAPVPTRLSIENPSKTTSNQLTINNFFQPSNQNNINTNTGKQDQLHNYQPGQVANSVLHNPYIGNNSYQNTQGANIQPLHNPYDQFKVSPYQQLDSQYQHNMNALQNPGRPPMQTLPVIDSTSINVDKNDPYAFDF